jgi:hypothetical protein
LIAFDTDVLTEVLLGNARYAARAAAIPEEALIAWDEQPVAKLVSLQKAARRLPQPGSAQGMLIINVEDEEHLEDFKGYMP